MELALAAAGGAEADRTLLEPLCAAAERAWLARLQEGVSEEDCGEALLCAAAVEELTGLLREGITAGDCGGAFPLAAAMLVMDGLSGMTGGGETASFTAGDLTIRRESGGSGSGKSLSARAEGLLAPWLRDGRFVFQGVEG